MASGYKAKVNQYPGIPSIIHAPGHPFIRVGGIRDTSQPVSSDPPRRSQASEVWSINLYYPSARMPCALNDLAEFWLCS